MVKMRELVARLVSNQKPLAWACVVGLLSERMKGLRRDNERMSLSACPDVAAADWLVGQDMRWYQLATKGPLGFPAYARLRFLQDPAFEGQKEIAADYPDDALDETEQLAE